MSQTEQERVRRLRREKMLRKDDAEVSTPKKPAQEEPVPQPGGAVELTPEPKKQSSEQHVGTQPTQSAAESARRIRRQKLLNKLKSEGAEQESQPLLARQQSFSPQTQSGWKEPLLLNKKEFDRQKQELKMEKYLEPLPYVLGCVVALLFVQTRQSYIGLASTLMLISSSLFYLVRIKNEMRLSFSSKIEKIEGLLRVGRLVLRSARGVVILAGATVLFLDLFLSLKQYLS